VGILSVLKKDLVKAENTLVRCGPLTDSEAAKSSTRRLPELPQFLSETRRAGVLVFEPEGEGPSLRSALLPYLTDVEIAQLSLIC